MVMDEEALEKKIDEGLFPELAPKVVKINDHWSINIVEMPVFYVKQLNRLLEPFYTLFKGGFDGSHLLDADFIEKHYDELLEAAYFIALFHLEREQYKDAPVNDKEFWEKKPLSNTKRLSKTYLAKKCAERQLLNLIYTQLEVNGHVNFFKMLLKGVIQMAAILTTNQSTQ